jgi:hypothetical protein
LAFSSEALASKELGKDPENFDIENKKVDVTSSKLLLWKVTSMGE